MDFYAANSSAAVQHCRNLLQSGEAHFFRGQTRDWPRIAPSLMRTTGPQLDEARQKLSDFVAWALSVPQMFGYNENLDTLTAIAQHYGIPTNFLDLTVDPEIALIFAKNDGTKNTSQEKSVIYYFTQRDLVSIAGLTLVEIEIPNLWRIEAQHGLFASLTDLSSADLLSKVAKKIFFLQKISRRLKNLQFIL